MAFWILSLTAICMACEPATETNDPHAKSNTLTTPSNHKAAPMASEEDKQLCKEAVESLLKIAESGKNKDAASLLAYRGEDKEREWKSVCDYSREEDRLYVDKTMAKLQVIRSGLQSHDFREFIIEKEHEGLWHVWVTDMHYEDGTADTKAFAFLKINDKFALGDID